MILALFGIQAIFFVGWDNIVITFNALLLVANIDSKLVFMVT